MTTKKTNMKSGSVRDNAVGLGLLALAVVLLVIMAIAAPGSGEAAGTGTVQFSEIMSSNASALMLSDGTLPDWIEIVNNGEKDANLNGYALMIDGDPTRMYRFAGTTIPAGGRIVLLADSGNGNGHLPFKLAASGQNLVLMNPAGQTADAVQTPSLDADQVYCRDENGEWQLSYAATPGEKNRVSETAAENYTVTQAGGDVVITEVMARNATYAPDENGEYWDYVELTNLSDAPVSLKGWYLTDDRTNIARWQFPDIALEAGGTLLVHCSGYDRKDDVKHLHANFRLGSDGATVLLTRGGNQTAALVDVPALETDQAYSLVNGRWTGGFAPTPGAVNTAENAAMAGESIRRGNVHGVIINEIVAATSTSAPDWVEIYNAGSQAVDLSGWGLSDNAARPRKWQFPAGSMLQPGQYAAVFCSGENKNENGQMHTNFNLAVEGGYAVTLSQPDGAIVDRIYVPRQYEDISYGRIDGREGLYYFTLSTPVAKNDGIPYMGKAEAPEYSVRGGLFNAGDSIQLEMTAQPGARIHYTLDSSDPNEGSPMYTGPITITGTTILRTRVYADGYLESYMDTQSYLFDVNNAGGVYVVSLVSDPANLTSDEKGIMVKGPNASEKYPHTGANFWQDWEHEAHVEVFGGDGEELLSQSCGIKLHGQYSRAEKQQAFKVIARTKYGSNRFPIELFSARDYTEYQSFVLRSSGQDTDKTRMRDSILSALAKDTSVLYQETEICVLYLDGQYWGQYNLRERINPESICQFEGWEGQEDNIDLVKANSNTMQGSNDSFAALLQAVKSADQTTDEFYQNLDKAIDIQNYIEYMAVQIFTGNTDTLNVKRYRNANADGRWRWVLFDLDWAFYTDTNSINRWLTPGGMGANSRTDNSLFIACMKNPRFRDEFLTHMGKEMATTFTSENVVGMIHERYEILKPLLDDQLARWETSWDKFEKEMKTLINYAEERPMKLLSYFAGTEHLKLTEEEMYRYFGDALTAAQSYGA